jgi:hypothetical protein
MTFPCASIKVDGKHALTVNGSFDVVENRHVAVVVVVLVVVVVVVLLVAVLHTLVEDEGFVTWNADTPVAMTPRMKADLTIIIIHDDLSIYIYVVKG